MKSGNLKLLETSGSLQACNGTALPFSVTLLELSLNGLWRCVSTQTQYTGWPKSSVIWHPVVAIVIPHFSKDHLSHILEDAADTEHKPRRWRHSALSKHPSRTFSITQHYSIIFRTQCVFHTTKSRTSLTLHAINQQTTKRYALCNTWTQLH